MTAARVESKRWFGLALLGVALVFVGLSACRSKSHCLPSNCNGCCDQDRCVAIGDQSDGQCGIDGLACRSCATDQSCQVGRCLTTVDAGTPNEFLSCGGRGQECCTGNAGCLRGLYCNGGICQNTIGTAALPVDPAVNPGKLPIGDPCTANSECGTDRCYTQQAGFTGGICSAPCATATDCPAGTTCAYDPFDDSGGARRLCLKTCSPAGSATTCRAGYVCESFRTSLNGSPVCYVGCSATTARRCAVDSSCDSRGYCCGGPGEVCCESTSCSTGNSCVAGSCVPAPAGASANGAACTTASACSGVACLDEGVPSMGCSVACWPSGYCSQACAPSAACPSGSSCSELFEAFSVGNCLANCTPDGGRSTCRADYVCDRGWVSASTQGTCVPACHADQDCPWPAVCANGFCCGAVSFACCAQGATQTCPFGGTCNAGGYCE